MAVFGATKISSWYLDCMNTSQWIVVAVATVILAVSVLFPPWSYMCDGWLRSSAGYHFIATPPSAKDICPKSVPMPPLPQVLRNGRRQYEQAAVVLILAVGLLLGFKAQRTNLTVLMAVLTISIGVIGLMYLGLIVQLEM